MTSATAAAIVGANNNVQALSRNLDKTFEDAQLTAVLTLSGRNLKEFPNVASRYDLTDTVEADLSKNRFNEFPVQITEYSSLETLYLYHNCIRSISPAVQYLESLTYLDLSRNQLQSVPPELCVLPLAVLLLSNNCLTSLPREICRLSNTLMELDVSCNKLDELPVEIGDVKFLRVLNVRGNALSDIPLTLCKLNLQILDLTHNHVARLTAELCKMTSLVQLKLNDNPLMLPPAKMCDSGKVHIFKSLSATITKQQPKRSVGTFGSSRHPRLMPTDPDDLRYSNLRSDKRKYRHHTVVADSGYSTLSGDSLKTAAGEAICSTDISQNYSTRYDFSIKRHLAPSSATSTIASSPYLTADAEHLTVPPSSSSNSLTTMMMTQSLCSNNSNSASSTLSNSTTIAGSRLSMNVSSRPGSFVEEVLTACNERIMTKTVSNCSQPMTSSTGQQYQNVGHQYQQQQHNHSSTLAGGNNNNCNVVAEDDEISRELKRQREEYLLRKKRAGILRMEMLKDAAEESTPSFDVGENHRNREENGFDHTSATNQKPIPDVQATLSSISESNPQQYVENHVISASISSTLVLGQSHAAVVTLPQNMEFKAAKTFSPPKAAKSDVIRSIYTNTDSLKRFSNYVVSPAINGGTANSDQSQQRERPTLAPSAALKRGENVCNGIVNDSNDLVLACTSSSDASTASNSCVQSPSSSLIENNNNNNNEDADDDKMSGNNDRKNLLSGQNGVGGVGICSTENKIRTTKHTGQPTASGRTSSASNSCNSSTSSSGSTCKPKTSVGIKPTAGTLTSRAPSIQKPRQPPPPTPVRTSSINSGKAQGIESGRLSMLSGTKPINGTVLRNIPSSVVPPTSKNATLSHNERQQKCIDSMRQLFKDKINVDLPQDHAQMTEALCDGVHLCNFLNHLRPKTVRSIHLPGESSLKVALAKRNVENFISGCRSLGIPEASLFAVHDLIDKRNLNLVWKTTTALLKHVAPSLMVNNHNSNRIAVTTKPSVSPP